MTEGIKATNNKKKIPGGMFNVSIDDDLTIVRANDYFYQLFGYTREEAEKEGFNNLRQRVPPQDQDSLRGRIIKVIQVKRDEFDLEFQGVHKSNSLLWLLVRGWYDEDTKEIKGVLIDITKRKSREESAKTAELDRTKDELKKEYFRDSLTGLLNRKGIMESFASLIERRGEELHGFLMIDLDDFKTHNDHGGHLFGDKVLGEVAKKLQGLFRSEDIVGRLGGDEFIVILTGIPGLEALKRKAQMVNDTLERLLENGRPLSSSQGIALYPKDGATFMELYKKADAALYEAKALGKNQYVIYSENPKDIIHKAVKGKKPDISGVEDIVEELKEIKEIYRWGLEKARVAFWEYDIENSTFVNNLGQSFNGIDSMIKAGKIHKDSAIEVSRLKEEVKAGREEGELFIKGKGPEKTFEWLKISYRTMRRTGKDSLRIFAVAEVLPGEIRSKIRYVREEWIKRELLGLGLKVYITNLSKNIVEIGKPKDLPFNRANERNEIKTYGDVLNTIGDSFAKSGKSGEFKKMFSRDQLIERFNQGEDSIKEMVQMTDQKGKLRWVTFYSRIIIHPGTGDYYSYTYLKEDDERGRRENASVEPLSRESITGLYEEDTFVKIVNQILRQKKSNKNYGLIVLDIANYSYQNSYMGEKIFTQNFSRIAEDLRLILPSRYICATKEKGEFIIFVEEEQSTSIKEESEKFLTKLRGLFRLLDPKGTFLIYSGIASWSRGESYQSLYEKAFAAQNAAATGDNWSYAFYGDKGKKASTPGVVLEEEIIFDRYNFLHDSRTGIYNRFEYSNVLEQLQTEGLSSLGVLILELNEVEEKNTLEGMKNLERKSQQIAEAIGCICKDCEAYRVAEDEFVILCRDVTLEFFMSISTKIQESLALMLPGVVSLGYCWSGENVDVDRLLEHAEELKEIDHLKFREGLVNNQGKNQEEALSNLLRDIKNNRFSISIQPIVFAQTGGIRGGEALVRKIDDEGCLHLPVEFIRNYETLGIIRYIDLFVLEETCKVRSRWITPGSTVVPIAVNFSRETLLELGIIAEIIKLSEKYGVPRELIEIEVTERLGDVEESTIMGIATSIKESGFGLSLDDFGTEYSNLSVVGSLKLDTLKIDRSLINQIHESRTTEVIIRSILQLCKELGIKSVAEGVETKSQSDALKSWGCDFLQGFYYSKALPVEDFRKLYLSKDYSLKL